MQQPSGTEGIPPMTRPPASMLLALTAALLCLSASTPALALTRHTGASVLAEDESGLANAMNAQRASAGVAPLAVDPALTDIARGRSDDQVSRGYFSHVTPDGQTIFDILTADGVPWTAAGENLAESRGEDPVDAAITGFMQSPEHRDNVLNGEFHHVGVGAAQTADGITILSVVFTN
jgi:uncharacterized protein YkwD